MNNWLRTGVPILVAVLLVASAVSVTLAVTSESRGSQVAASSVPAAVSNGNALNAPACPNCIGNNQSTTSDQGTANQVYIPKGKGGTCCGVSQGVASTQAYTGGCCGVSAQGGSSTPAFTGGCCGAR